MKKKNVFLILIAIFLLIGIGILLKNNSSNRYYNNISITQYKTGTFSKLKNINIDNDNDKKN